MKVVAKQSTQAVHCTSHSYALRSMRKRKTRKTVYTDYERKPPERLLRGMCSVSTTAKRKHRFEFLWLLGNEMLACSHMLQ